MTLVSRIEPGGAIAHVAAEMGVSRPTAYTWWHRWQAEGVTGLLDRSSRPHRCPHRTPAAVEGEIVALRTTLKRGPVGIGLQLGVPAWTVHRVLCRSALNRLRWLDRPTGRVIRRIHTQRPGEQVDVDLKKLGRIPDGGSTAGSTRPTLTAATPPSEATLRSAVSTTSLGTTDVDHPADQYI